MQIQETKYLNSPKSGDHDIAVSPTSIDIDRLEFPQHIAHIIGVRKETLYYWKDKGCPFIGRKTTIRWVRDFMAMVAGVASPYSMPSLNP